MKLVLHIGAHKTATTSIQRTLAKNRSTLLGSGIWYPGYSELFPNMSDHYAHLDVAKGLMSDSRRFTPEKVATFFTKAHNKASRMRNMNAVLISAEPFYRGRMPGDEPLEQRRRDYVARLREIVPFDPAEVVLVLRRQDNYLESLYNEHVKVTRYTKDIWTFLKEYEFRFDYRGQIQLWSEFFPNIKVFTFEELVAERTPTLTFLRAVFGPIKIDLKPAEEESNASLPIDMVDFKSLLNQTSLSRRELANVVSILESMARKRGKSERTTRLSVQDRKDIIEQFAGENTWVNDAFFASRPGGLFPAKITEHPAAPELDTASAVNLAADVIKRQLRNKE